MTSRRLVFVAALALLGCPIEPPHPQDGYVFAVKQAPRFRLDSDVKPLRYVGVAWSNDPGDGPYRRVERAFDLALRQTADQALRDRGKLGESATDPDLLVRVHLKLEDPRCGEPAFVGDGAAASYAERHVSRAMTGTVTFQVRGGRTQAEELPKVTLLYVQTFDLKEIVDPNSGRLIRFDFGPISYDGLEDELALRLESDWYARITSLLAKFLDEPQGA